MSDTVLDVINRAARLLGDLASGASLSGAESNDALQAYNSMYRGLFGTVIGPRPSSILTAVNVTAQPGYIYGVGSATITITLPPNPRPGSRIGVSDANAALATYPVTVARSGHLLEGAAANLTLNTNGATRQWFYRPDAANWVREADQALIDTPPFSDDLIGFMPAMLAVHMASEYGADIRPDVAALAQYGYAAFARVYARRGRNQSEPPLGVNVAGQTQGG